MHVRIQAKRPNFETIFKICAASLFSYVVAVFALAGVFALFGRLEVDPNLRTIDLVIGGVIGPVAVPSILGFVFAVPTVALWSIYGRIRKSTIVLFIESRDDVMIVETEAQPGATDNPDGAQ